MVLWKEVAVKYHLNNDYVIWLGCVLGSCGDVHSLKAWCKVDSKDHSNGFTKLHTGWNTGVIQWHLARFVLVRLFNGALTNVTSS